MTGTSRLRSTVGVEPAVAPGPEVEGFEGPRLRSTLGAPTPAGYEPAPPVGGARLRGTAPGRSRSLARTTAEHRLGRITTELPVGWTPPAPPPV